MKNKFKSNSGFTLIELVIAMAILAFLMTAVSSLMGSSILSQNKAKADVGLQTAAQETYNQMGDSIMQANQIVLIGYETASAVDFSKQGASVTVDTPELFYYVSGDDMAKYITDPSNITMYKHQINPSSLLAPVYGTGGNIKYFSDLGVDEDVYVVKMYVVTAENIDLDMVYGYVDMGTHYTVIDRIHTLPDYVTNKGTDSNGNIIFDKNDDVYNIYTFKDGKLYYETVYKYMNLLTDKINWNNTESLERHVYSDCFKYVVDQADSTRTITGCVVNVDAENGSLSIDLMYGKNSMVYNTVGKVNVRNSYVLKESKSN